MTDTSIESSSDRLIQPFWSVMIPVYNPNLDLLRETVESVFASGLDVGDVQIVLVDDGSNKSGLDAFYHEMAERSVVVHHNLERIGLVGNWNVCISLARGRWIHILHQDDRIKPGFYAAMEEGISKRPSVGAACCQIAFIDGAGRLLRHGHMTQAMAGPMDNWIEHLTVNLVVQCPGMVVRRAVYDRLGGFDTTFTYNADQEMWQRIGAEYPIWYEPRPLAEYRVHPASASNQLYDLSCRWRELRNCLARGLALVSPLIRDKVRQSGSYYRTCLAWHEWLSAWRSERRILSRLKLVPLLVQMGDLRHLLARRRRRFPRPIPSLAPVRDCDPAVVRKKRILFLSEFFPADPLRSVFGVFQRMRSTMEACGEVGQVDVLFFWGNNYQVPPDQVEKYRQAMREACWPVSGDLLFVATSAGAGSESRRQPVRAALWLLRGVATFMPHQPTLRSCGNRQVTKLRDILLRIQPDLIFVHRMGAAGALSRVGLPLPPVVMDMDDVEHVKITRMHAHVTSWRDRAYVKLCAFIARQCERRFCRLSNVTLVCSEHDRREVLRIAPNASVEVVPNVGQAVNVLPEIDEPSAIFIGIAHYPPNREAIEWLVREIWPRVRLRVPKARLNIAGQASALVAADDEAGGIKVWGYVSEVEPCYRDSAIAVCPIMKGSGTRIKIIEAALLGRPCVSTVIGAEGLDFIAGKEIVIADSSQEFADAVANLLLDPALRQSIGLAAREKAMALYHPDNLVKKVSSILKHEMNATRS